MNAVPAYKPIDTKVKVTYTDHGVEKEFEAVGNGPIDAVQRGLQQELGIAIKVLDYEEHALQSGASSQAAAYRALRRSRGSPWCPLPAPARPPCQTAAPSGSDRPSRLLRMFFRHFLKKQPIPLFLPWHQVLLVG